MSKCIFCEFHTHNLDSSRHHFLVCEKNPQNSEKFIIQTCEKCSKQFSYIPKHSHTKRFCSYKCSNSKSWTKEDNLKKSNSAKNSEKSKRSREILKSQKRGIYKLIEKIKLSCVGCQIEYSVLPHEAKGRSYCSRKCFLEKGWKGGSRWKGKYQEIRYESSFELAFLIYCIENSISIQRCQEWFHYTTSSGKSRKYNPDYFLPKTQEYIEIKGLENETDKEKWSQFPAEKTLKILREVDLYVHFKYVRRKYGEDFYKKV